MHFYNLYTNYYEVYNELGYGFLEKVHNMLNHVETILNKHNLSFDEIHLNWGGDTYNFKTKLFETLIKEVGATEMVMYDDRSEHLVRFEEWAEEHHIDITVVDVINKKETNYPNNI